MRISQTAFLSNRENVSHTSGSSDIRLPIKASSLHSKIKRLTIGSKSPSVGSFANLVRINGSVFPPQALRLYMPEHCNRLEASCVCDRYVKTEDRIQRSPIAIPIPLHLQELVLPIRQTAQAPESSFSFRLHNWSYNTGLLKSKIKSS